MHIAVHQIASAALAEDFTIKVFGKTGKPFMAFPTSKGRVGDYESNGMIAALAPFIDAGDLCIVCVDGRDWLTWFAAEKNASMGRIHQAWEHCVTREIIAFLHKTYGWSERYVATGCSWGGYHAVNFAVKFPWLFDVSIALSGAYTLGHAVGGYSDESVFYNDILAYLPGLTDEKLVAPLRQSYFAICHGRGSWEQCNAEAAAVAALLRAKGVTCWYDVWDENWPHDWHAWRAQIVHFANHLRQGVLDATCPEGRRIAIGPDRERRAIEHLTK